MGSPNQTELERATLDHPDDPQAFEVYGDCLSQAGDPRGELILVQLRLEDSTLATDERDRLVARERSLLDEHRDAWLGPLAAVLCDFEGEQWEHRRFTFRRGFCTRSTRVSSTARS